MKRFQYIFRSVLLVFSMSFTHNIQAAQTSSDIYGDSMQISLLTCGPGHEIYSLYGHTAIRFQDLRNHQDLVINYGIFSFRQKYFILRFVFGLTDYEMGIIPYEDFYEEYKSEGRWVKEQTLNLSPQDKQNVALAIDKNYMPENRTYRYNYFYDNCTTRARDILINNMNGFVDYHGYQYFTSSYREEIHQWNKQHQWAKWGNDLLLGFKADRPLSMEERQFLPDSLSHDFQHAIVNYGHGKTKKLVSKSSYLLSPTTTRNIEERQIEKKIINGKEYGYIKPNESDYEWVEEPDYGTWELKKVKKVIKEFKYLTPKRYITGYHTGMIWDRDLNTDTNQLNLDFEKEFDAFSTEHFLKYGSGYEKTKKSMVNKDRYGYYNLQWWKDIFVSSEPGKQDEFVGGGKKVPKIDYYTYLIPVETTTKHFYIGDEIKATNWLGLDVGYRRDNIKMVPKYTGYPEVPRGIITGIFKPYGNECDPYNGSSGGYYSPGCDKNFKENVAILTKPKNYNGNSYNFGLNFDPLDYMRLQLKYANAFRAPTSDELYMTFKFYPSFLLVPNINLKPEISKTKEVALTFYKNKSFITLNVFKTKYDNFIELAQAGFQKVDSKYLPYEKWQTISSLLELGEISDKLDGFRTGYKFTHQKGRILVTENWENYDGKHTWQGWRPMNAIQPDTHVFSLGYSAPNDKFGIDLFLTTVAANKAKDSYNLYWRDPKANGKPVTDSSWAWRNKTYSVLDAVAYYNPNKNFNFSFGVYNITNQKYASWDNLRSIRTFGTTNLIDQNTGQGIGRFYAPKRNFKFNWEIKF